MRKTTVTITILFFAITSGYAIRRCLIVDRKTPTQHVDPPALSMRIAIPEFEVALDKLDIATQKRIYPHVYVVIENISDKPQSIFDDWNSWGYFNLTLAYDGPDGVHGTITKIPVAWNMNFPSATAIQPGQVLVRDIYLDRKIWNGIPNLNDPRRFSAPALPFKVRAIFKQEEDQSLKAWHGSIESPVIQINFAGYR